MKIGFTGTQQGMTRRQAFYVKRYLQKATSFHHGDCIGADCDAHHIAARLHIPIFIYPPESEHKRAWCRAIGDTIYRPAPYLERNHAIVDATVGLIVCPKEKEEQLRSGTWATYRYARKRGKWVCLILPDGTVIKTKA